MQERKDLTEITSIECDYQPQQDSLAGFLVSLSHKVDELLAAANWQPASE
jgi:hypothetical protein